MRQALHGENFFRVMNCSSLAASSLHTYIPVYSNKGQSDFGRLKAHTQCELLGKIFELRPLTRELVHVAILILVGQETVLEAGEHCLVPEDGYVLA